MCTDHCLRFVEILTDPDLTISHVYRALFEVCILGDPDLTISYVYRSLFEVCRNGNRLLL
jgi:hypothetical protein